MSSLGIDLLIASSEQSPLSDGMNVLDAKNVSIVNVARLATH
jgi:hypothetical protein